MNYSTDHIDYLSRKYLDDFQGLIKTGFLKDKIYFPDKETIQHLQINGISRTWQEGVVGREEEKQKRTRYRTIDLLIGCYATQTPLFFLIQGINSKLKISFGTFSPGRFNNKPPVKNVSIEFLKKSLEAYYPGILLKESDLEINGLNNFYGIITGIPTLKQSDDNESPTQMDYLIRSMTGHTWNVLLVANPVDRTQPKVLQH